MNIFNLSAFSLNSLFLFSLPLFLALDRREKTIIIVHV